MIEPTWQPYATAGIWPVPLITAGDGHVIEARCPACDSPARTYCGGVDRLGEHGAARAHGGVGCVGSGMPVTPTGWVAPTRSEPGGQ